MRYIIFLLISLTASITAQAQTFFDLSLIRVPATGTTTGIASPYPKTITVSGITNPVTKLTVNLNSVSHTFPDDIDIILVGPTGAKIYLMSDVGAGTDITSQSFVFDDAAASALPDVGPLVGGTYRPTNIGVTDTFPAPAPSGPYGTTLSTFNGLDPNGIWSLYINDDSSGDVGVVGVGWALNFIAPTAAGVSIGGRVLTEDGRGIYKARVSLTDANGNTRTVISNQFGYYRFNDTEIGQTYIIDAVHKNHQFAPQTIFPTEDVSEINITAQPRFMKSP